MSALRCSLCGIHYPVHPQFQNCPIHAEDTALISDAEPDKDWRERAERLALQLKSKAATTIPRAEGVPVFEEDGRLYVSHWDLVKAGIRFPVGGRSFQLFELDGFIYETQGWHESGRRWWVEKVAPALVVADAPSASAH